MNLYIFKYNNYYNRIVKYEDTLADYGQYIHLIQNVKDFSPNDGVNTSHVFGSPALNYDGSGDYVIYTDEYDNIISRWFLIETKFTRAGQWNLTLRRDLLVDYLEDIIDADTYIEKAIVPDTDPLIFNSEQLAVNQIKTRQTELIDNSSSAWLVGYLSAKQPDDITITASKPIDYNISVPNINQWEYYKYSNLAPSGEKETAYTQLSSANLKVQIANYLQPGEATNIFNYNLTGSGNPYITNGTVHDKSKLELYFDNQKANSSDINKAMQEISSQLQKENIVNLAKGQYNYFDYYTVYNAINGQVIYDQANDKYYSISVRSLDAPALNYKPTVTSQQDLDLVSYVLGNRVSIDYQNKADVFLTNGAIRRSQNLGTRAETSFQVILAVKDLKINLEEVFGVTSTLTIPTSVKTLKDAPYKMFCMPYKIGGDFAFIKGNEVYTMNKDTSMAIMTKLVSELSGGSVLYDAQILPYCPCKEYINQFNNFSFDTLISGELPKEDIDYVLVKGKNEVVQGFIMFCDYASFNTVINEPIHINNVKISNECDKYRICSPNFNGAFEFNAAKNGGVQGFNVTCTYRPYSPYIKVAPSFGNLYGKNFKDPRGLICGGEFGLPLASDQWATYEINNKNYLNAFNRQIENMEVQQKYQRIGDIASAISGTLSGAASGALAGSMMGGAIAGGVVGGVASAAGGVADIFMNEQLRNEAIDYTKDQFNYSLENIQALPYTLSRVSSFTKDNTIFPILEYYTCTLREKVAMANKIAYNGMTVMAIGKIKDYLEYSWSYTYRNEKGGTSTIGSKGYIKGKIIRMQDLEDEYHLVKEIANEINKGVYF